MTRSRDRVLGALFRSAERTCAKLRGEKAGVAFREPQCLDIPELRFFGLVRKHKAGDIGKRQVLCMVIRSVLNREITWRSVSFRK